MAEIQQIEKQIAKVEKLSPKARTEVLAYSEKGPLRFPIYKLSFGTEDPQAPVLGLIGGVHGLERIGSQVCISLMNSIAELSRWDLNTQRTLENLRVFFIPTVNPVGIYRKTRCNPRGVDLMRNAPVEAENSAFLVGGHRLSNVLPWYRGAEGAPMEVESRAVVDSIQKEISKSRFAVTLDIHSGFGFQDRLWFPYAKTIRPFPDLHIAHAFHHLLEQTYPHHFYRFEPQAHSYTTHGDLWDYLYDQQALLRGTGTYLPLCLEMGSWMWVKKNPWQIFLADGPFNPLKAHRQRRTLRRHNTLMELLVRATSSTDSWLPKSPEQIQMQERGARELWYSRE